MIPKIIHYCWFSNDPIPENLRICMNSWRKALPDYTWKKWTLSSFDVNALAWTKEACKAKAWAFVTDYVRLYALYNEGGIYLDTDVWVKKSFDDFLSHGFFTSIEYHPEMIKADEIASKRLDSNGANLFPGTRVPGLGLQAAILGAEKGHPYLEEALSFYYKNHFIQENGEWYTSLIAPDVLALAAEKFDLCYNRNIEQKLKCNMTIYPYYIFGGAYTQVNKSTVAVHLSAGGWRQRTLWRTFLTRANFYKKIFFAKRK